MTMKQAADEYLAGADLKARTLKAYRVALVEHALPYFGVGERIENVGQRQFAGFVAALAEDDTRSKQTKEGYIYAVTGMFKWHRLRGAPVAALSAATLLPRQDRPDASGREAFSTAQLQILFANARRYLSKEPGKFWATVGAAFTGCRIEELAQVNLHTDLHHDDAAGIWYLNLNEDADRDGITRKSIKRLSSWRVVPLHSSLIKHGFLGYLEDTCCRSATRVLTVHLSESGSRGLTPRTALPNGRITSASGAAANWISSSAMGR